MICFNLLIWVGKNEFYGFLEWWIFWFDECSDVWFVVQCNFGVDLFQWWIGLIFYFGYSVFCIVIGKGYWIFKVCKYGNLLIELIILS